MLLDFYDFSAVVDNHVDTLLVPDNLGSIEYSEPKFKHEEDEDLNLDKKQHEMQPEDEEFLRDLQRAMTETYQVYLTTFNRQFTSRTRLSA